MSPSYVGVGGVWRLLDGALPAVVARVLASAGFQLLTSEGTTVDTLLAARAALVPGSYKPNSRAVSGVVSDIADLTPVLPNGVDAKGQPYCTVTAAGGPYRSKIFWGQVRSSGPGVIPFDNCWAAGSDPGTFDSYGSYPIGNIRNYTAGQARQIWRDSTVSARPWLENAAWKPAGYPVRTAIHPDSAGVHGGGDMELYRCEITDVQDGVNFVARTGQNHLMEACWVHRMSYLSAWTGPGHPASLDTHSDCWQMNIGGNVVIRYSYLGGPQDNTGYLSVPGYNSGDDSHNSIFMLKQEVDMTTANHAGPFLAHDNWIEGASYAVHLHYDTNKPNKLDDFSFLRNKFVQRGPNVRATAYNTSTGTAYDNGPGGYVVKNADIQANFPVTGSDANRVVLPDGTDVGPVPFLINEN